MRALINQSKILNSLVFMGVIIATWFYARSETTLFVIAVCFIVITAITSFLLSEKKELKAVSSLPKVAEAGLRSSLHLSQIPLLERIIIPVLASELIALRTQIIGAKVNGEPLSLFDEKIAYLTKAFQSLKTSRRLYTNRVLEEQDYAITALVFFTVLYDGIDGAVSLREKLSVIPPAIYTLTKGHSYRLFDISSFILERKILCNQDVVDVLAGIDAFNAVQKNKLTPTQETESAPDLISPELPEAITTHTLKENDVCQLDIASASHDTSTEQSETSIIDPEPQMGEESAQRVELVTPFIEWLEKRIESNNRKFSPASQMLIKTSLAYEKEVVFVEPDVLAKYQSRSGVDMGVLEKALSRAFNSQSFFVSGDDRSQVFPVKLSSPIDVATTSDIHKGE